MGNISGVKKTQQSVTVGRECDVCGFKELSNRIEIKFDHGRDSKWAKIQLHLDDYTDPNDKRYYYACSAQCTRTLLVEKSSVYTKERDCLGGIPTSHIREILK